MLALLAPLVVLAGIGEARGGPSGKGGLGEQVARRVGAYEASSGAIVGLSAIDLRTGEALLDTRSGELFAPASNQKLLTGAAALVRLGAEFAFTTSVYRLGADVVVVGDGDPTLGDPRLAEQAGESIYAELDRWSAAVAGKVGGVIEGDLLVCSRFPLTGFRHPDWPTAQHHRWYAAPVAGLNFHDNCFDVTFTVADAKVVPHVLPQSRFIRIVSAVKPGKRHIWSLQSNADDSQVKLRGTVRRTTRDPLSVAANNPPLLLARTFADRIVRTGVSFTGEVRSVKPRDVDLSRAELLARTTTPLSVAMRRANKRSLNMAAECIFLRTGDGTWKGSAAIVSETLIREFRLEAKSLVVRDGGGLSPKNRVSPRTIVRVLRGVAKRSDAAVLIASLPKSGIDGSMRSRLSTATSRGRVLSKTGSIAGASCLSGYILGRTGKPAIAFSILINRVPPGATWIARQLQDAVCESLVRTADLE